MWPAAQMDYREEISQKKSHYLSLEISLIMADSTLVT